MQGLGGVFELAWKFITSDGQGSLVKLLVRISVAGMAIGVAALIVVFSVIHGFKAEFAKAVSNSQGHVLFTTRERAFLDDEITRKEILRFSEPGAHISPYFMIEAMGVSQAAQAGILYEGVSNEMLSSALKFTHGLAPTLVQGHWPSEPEDVVIGEGLAQRLNLKPGDPFELMVADNAHVLPKRFLKTVSGIIKYGFFEVDSKAVFARLSIAQEELNLGSRVSGYRIYLKDLSQSQTVAGNLRDRFGYPYKIREWYSLHRNLLLAVEHQKKVIGVLLSAIILIAVFNVVSALLIFSKEREYDFAILKVLGARHSAILVLLLSLGTFIGVVGVSVGVVMGVGLCLILGSSSFLRIPPEIYYLDRLPVTLNFSEVALIAGLALALTISVSILAGLWQARQSPLEGVRSSV